MTESTTTTCKCGCGQRTTSGSTYRPGHDAKHVSMLIKTLWDLDAFRGNDAPAAAITTQTALATLPSSALKTKFMAALTRKVEKEWARFTAQSARGAEKAVCHFGWHPDEFWSGQTVTALATKTPVTADGGEIKVGRWTYPTGSRPGQGTIYRNTKRDGSGDWVKVS